MSGLASGFWQSGFTLKPAEPLLVRIRGGVRRGPESNRRIQLLQSRALPLGYPAAGGKLYSWSFRDNINFGGHINFGGVFG